MKKIYVLFALGLVFLLSAIGYSSCDNFIDPINSDSLKIATVSTVPVISETLYPSTEPETKPVTSIIQVVTTTATITIEDVTNVSETTMDILTIDTPANNENHNLNLPTTQLDDPNAPRTQSIATQSTNLNVGSVTDTSSGITTIGIPGVSFSPVTREHSQTNNITETSSMYYTDVTNPAAVQVSSVTSQTAVSTVQLQISEAYGYSQLSAENKVTYDKIYNAAINRTTIIKLNPKVNIQTLTNIYTMIYQDEIKLQHISSSFRYDANEVGVMQIEFTRTPEVAANMNKKLDEKVNAIIAKVKPNMNDFDKVKLFHDAIISGCTYTLEGANVSTAYGVLVDGKALCQGYAQALSYLCNKVGITNTFVVGYAKEPHMWNLIKMNGEWYHVDATWDDPDNKAVPSLIIYDYFGLSTTQIQKDHQVYAATVLTPNTSAVSENYYVKNKSLANNYKESRQMVFNEALKATNENRDYFSVKYTNKAAYDESVKNFFVEEDIFTILKQVNEHAINKINSSSVNFITNNDNLIITFLKP